MALSPFAFDPPTGWNDPTEFPVFVASEQEVRAKFQELHDQTRDEINTIITEVNGKASSSSPTISNPTLSGAPKASNPPAGNDSTRIATTHYVQGELAAYAPIASPAFTGNPTAPTQNEGNSSTRLATTAFVQRELDDRHLVLHYGVNPAEQYAAASDTYNIGGSVVVAYGAPNDVVYYIPLTNVEYYPASLGDYRFDFSGLTYGGTAVSFRLIPTSSGIIWTSVISKPMASLDSPAFTGSPTAQTPDYDDNSTKLATTAYVKYWDGLLLTQLTAALSENVSFSLGSAVSGYASVRGYVTKIGRMVFVNLALTIQTNFAVGISGPILVIDAPPISNGSGCFGVATPGTVFGYQGFSDHNYVLFSKSDNKCNVVLQDPISAGHPGTYYISGFYVTG